jgi:nucleoside-diphosphate-sugar epimerase
MKVLFIGGTGIISSACSKLALERGIELYHFNRGMSHRKINGVNTIKGDIRNISSAKKILGQYTFDVVVNWINFVPDQVKVDVELFKGRVKQYIFISSASAYQKPVVNLPITEQTPLDNPYWQYSRDKIACEEYLMREYSDTGFPATIVRPSHTYDNTLLPTDWGYTVLDRIKKGKKIIVHGDGTSLWVLTHHKDFAVGFVGLLGRQETVGQAYHITSDELLPWNSIYELLAEAAGKKCDIIHIPSDVIARYDERMGASLLGDKAHSVIFDNSKIKSLVPDFGAKISFTEGVHEIVQWYDERPEKQIVDKNTDSLIENIIKDYSVR